MKHHRLLYAGLGVLMLGLVIAMLYFVVGSRLVSSTAIPYDSTNPILYDNDSVEDAYTDELLMALQTSRKIVLRGMITTVGGWSEPGFSTEFLAADLTTGRNELVAKARRSGMTHAPGPVADP